MTEFTTADGTVGLAAVGHELYPSVEICAVLLFFLLFSFISRYFIYLFIYWQGFAPVPQMRHRWEWEWNA